VSFRDAGGGLSFRANFQGGGFISRRLDFTTGTVEHAQFELPRSLQGQGTAKKVLAAQIETYEQLGMKKVDAFANIDVGGYTWAKFGFVPSQKSWDSLRSQLKDRLSDYSTRTNPLISTETKDRVSAILDTRDPKAIWALSDLPDKTAQDESVAKSLMMNTDWAADLKLDDRRQMERFRKYVER
jgi:hypothetical protein